MNKLFQKACWMALIIIVAKLIMMWATYSEQKKADEEKRLYDEWQQLYKERCQSN